MATTGTNNMQAKLVLLGDMGTGKSSLVLRFVKGQSLDYQESTIGAAFFSHTLAVNEVTINDVVAWMLLALAIVLSNSGKSPVISVYVLLCGIASVALMRYANFQQIHMPMFKVLNILLFAFEIRVLAGPTRLATLSAQLRICWTSTLRGRNLKLC